MTQVLLGCAGLLLLLGGIYGHATRLFTRTEDDRATTWGTRGPLGAAFAAATIVVGLAVMRLATSGGAAAGSRRIVVRRLPLPLHRIPALDLTVRVDPTAAIFLLLVGTCGACIAAYSFGWLRDDPLANRVAGSFCLFLFAMVLVVVAGNIFWLFVGLEVMTFCSGDLVTYRGAAGGPVQASRNAVRTYLIVSHLALISLLIGILPIVVKHGTLDIGALSTRQHSASDFSFGFILLGLAIRAGVTPFHFWVPTVHPQLPTNTHAMVSAVMLKIPVYLMIRFFLGGIVGPVQWWWGALVLVLAGLTAAATVFYAMLSADLKVALAYHSVENVGIILAGLGLAMLFSARRFEHLPGLRAAAALALLASLYHVLNHGLFKSLLFLCVGSIERQTGTVELRRLGGLFRTLPWTAFTFLIGAAAIAELPPLNGFVSGWLTLQALFSGWKVYAAHRSVTLLLMPAVIVALVALALAFGMTGLAVVKIAGQSLLGEPRGARAPCREPWSMRAVMMVLAGLCVLLGLQPWLLVPWLSAALPPHFVRPRLAATPGELAIRVTHLGSGVYHATLPIAPLLLLAGLAVGLTVLLRAWRWTRRPVWVGGTELDPATMQYSGNAVSALLWEPMTGRRRRSTAAVSGRLDDRAAEPGDRPGMPYPDELRLSPRRSVPEFANFASNRLISRVVSWSYRVGGAIQNGDVRSYLFYMLVIVLLVLTVLAVAR